MLKISQKILAKIKLEKIAPRARWIFLAKNFGIWMLAIFAIIFTGIFLGNLAADLISAEWEIFERFPGGPVHFLSETIPIFWFVGLIATFIFAFFLFRKTKRGYRFGALALTGILLISSFVGGVSLLSTPFPGKIRELRFEKFPPPFNSADWMNPEDGFLFGEIIEVGVTVLILDSVDESIWNVDIAKAKIAPPVRLKIGERVRVIGSKLGENNFTAEFVQPDKPHNREMPRFLHF